jgi:hypothetical protein
MTYEKRVNEILVAHGLDFTIEKESLSGTKTQRLTPYYGLYNSKTGACINTCKEGYGVSQNSEIVEMVLRGMKRFGNKLKVTNAGSINEGRKVYLQLEIEGVGKVGNDVIKRYVTIIDSNDGSTSLSVGIGDKTMSCSNQFFRFYKAGQAKFRHTATIEDKIRSIPKLIEDALRVSLKMIDLYRNFQSTQVSRDLAHELVHAVLGYDKLSIKTRETPLSGRSMKMMESLYSHIDHQVADKGLNLWGMHSGVTRWTTHDKKGPNRLNGHDESMIAGIGYKKNQASLEFLAKRFDIKMDAELV